MQESIKQSKYKRHYTELTREDIESQIEYNPIDGVFSRKVIRGSKFSSGVNRVFNFDRFQEEQPNIFIRVNKEYYRIPTNRVAWILHYGVWNTVPIMHRNSNKLDFRISNLLCAPIKNQFKVKTILKNLDEHLRIKGHPVDQHKFTVSFIEDGRLKTKIFDGVSQASTFVKTKRAELEDILREFGCVLPES